MKKLVNQRFQFLQRWLFPGVSGNDSPPNFVNDSLASVVDIEHWVPVPRFQAFAVCPLVAGRTSVIAFENFVRSPPLTGPLGEAKPTRFVVTNLRVRQMLTTASNCFIATRTKTNAQGFPYDSPANATLANVGINTYSGSSEPFVQLFCGDSGLPGFGPVLYTSGDLLTWIPFPDLEAGNGMLFQGGIVAAALHLHISWTERRVEGEGNVT